MSQEPRGRGWWLASDGRYHPAQPTTVPPPPPRGPRLAGDPYAASSTRTTTPPSIRTPFYKHWWFWLIVGVGLVAIGIVAIVILVVIQSVPRQAALVDSQYYATQPDADPVLEGDILSTVTDGVLVLERQGDGPLYATVTDVPATSVMTIDAVMAWPDSGTGPEQDAYAGVVILNARGEGYALTCSTDGQAQVWAVGIEQSHSTDTYDDAECGTTFALGLDAQGGGFNLDMISVTLPNGDGAVILTGTRQGPFTSAGFVSLSPGTGSVPINVIKYEVSAAQ